VLDRPLSDVHMQGKGDKGENHTPIFPISAPVDCREEEGVSKFVLNVS
jgi:hypothetical protein